MNFFNTPLTLANFYQTTRFMMKANSVKISLENNYTKQFKSLRLTSTLVVKSSILTIRIICAEMVIASK